MTGTDSTITRDCAGHPDCDYSGVRPYVRGMCVNHYHQWYKKEGKGSDQIGPHLRGVDPIVKLRRYSSFSDRGCWIYGLSLDTHGYGRVWYQGKNWMAHKFAYVRLGAPYPPEFDLDHLCNQPACWNPDHIEPVPDRINLARGTGMIGAWAHMHATCVCCNRWAESCPNHGQLHWRPDWRDCLTSIYPEVAA